MHDAFSPLPPFPILPTLTLSPFILGTKRSTGKNSAGNNGREGATMRSSQELQPLVATAAKGRQRKQVLAATENGATSARAVDTGALATESADAELVNLLGHIAREDQAALAKFYDATVSRVYSVALRIVRLPDSAEEVTADVFMQVWRDAARYEIGRGRVLGWVLMIARSRALDHLRRQDEAFSHPEPHELADEPEANHANPQDLLLCSESNATLHAALAKLSPLQRQLLSLAFFKGFSHSEIVDHTGIALGSVKTHIRRSLGVLRDALGDSFDGHF
jgi:RNA polymerase sigma factor (sigma-70 family)